jgi:restriction system protein
MIKNNPTNVEAAFEILLEEVEAEIDFANNAGVRGFEARDYEKAKDALEQVAALTSFREKVSGLAREWKSLQSHHPQCQRRFNPDPPRRESPK